MRISGSNPLRIVVQKAKRTTSRLTDLLQGVTLGRPPKKDEFIPRFSEVIKARQRTPINMDGNIAPPPNYQPSRIFLKNGKDTIIPFEVKQYPGKTVVTEMDAKGNIDRLTYNPNGNLISHLFIDASGSASLERYSRTDTGEKIVKAIATTPTGIPTLSTRVSNWAA